MSRPKGSKNKKSDVTVIEPDQIEQDFEEQDEELRASAEESEFNEDVEEEDVKPPRGMTRVDQLDKPAATGEGAVLHAIREQTETLSRMMPPAKVHISKFKPISAFNPTGRKRTLKVIVYQNGYRCNPKTLHDREFDIINSGKIRPGQYLSKIVTVRIEKASSEEDQDKVFINYNNKTPDQRMMNKDHWNGFTDLLEKIVAESEARQVRVKQRRQRESAMYQ